MKTLFRAVDVVFEKNTKHDWDTVWVITGDEGYSKSTLLKHIIEYWMKLQKGKCEESDAERISLDILEFSKVLKEAKKFEIIPFDEAAEISNKRGMSKLNVILAQTYMIIRADNLFTILVIPSIFDLDGFFAKRRVRALLHVYKRGVFAFYTKDKVRQIISYNATKLYKRVNVVPPTFRDTYPKYKGILEEAYQKKKAARMQGARDKLYELLKNESEGMDDETVRKKDTLTKIERMGEVGLTTAQIAHVLGYSHPESISRLKKQIKTQLSAINKLEV